VLYLFLPIYIFETFFVRDISLELVYMCEKDIHARSMTGGGKNKYLPRKWLFKLLNGDGVWWELAATKQVSSN
jgi:hypothetical protein